MGKREKKKKAVKDKHQTQAVRQTETAESGKGMFRDNILEFGFLILIGVAPLVFLCMGGEFDNNPKMAVLQWGIALLALAAIVCFKGSVPLTWKRTPLDIPVLLFYGFCWLSLLQAVNRYTATLSLLHWAACIIFYFYITNTLKRAYTIDRFFLISALSVFFVSVIGILQKLWNITWIPQLTPPASTFSNKNMAAHMLAIGFPFIVGSFFMYKQRIIKFLSSVILAVTLLFLYYTKTRSAWIAVLAVSLVLIFFSFKQPFAGKIKATLGKKKFGYIGICIVVFLSLFWVSPLKKELHIDDGTLTERLASMGSLKEGSTAQLRTFWWKNTWEMTKDNIWLGVGLNNFKLIYPLYHRAVEVDWTFSEAKQVNRVHNDHLQMWVELGVFGFGAYASMFAVFIFLCVRVYLQANERNKARVLFILLSVVAFLIIAFFSFPVERAMPPVYIFICFGFIGFLYSTIRPKSFSLSGYGLQVGVRIGLALILILFLCSSVYFLRKIVLSDKYFVTALAYGDKGRAKESNELLQQAKIFSMWNFNIPALLARNYTMQGRYHKALEEYQESLRAHPNNINAMLNTGYCYLKMNEYDSAKQYFEKYLSIMPESAKGYNNLGIVYFSTKDYDRAIENYERAIAIEKDYAEPHFNLANLYRSQQKNEEAIQEYETALKLKPQMDEVRTLLSGLYLNAGQTEKAREVLAPVLAKKNKTAGAFITKGNMLQQKGKYRKALAQYDKALDITPQNPYLFYNIALTYYYMKEYAKSEEFLKGSIALNPNIAEAHNLLGQIYISKNKEKKALKLFKKALKLDPELRDAQYNVATVYLRLGNYQQAQTEYEKTLQLEPSFSLAHYNLGIIFRYKKAYEKALFHFEKSLVNPSALIDKKLTQEFVAEMKDKLANSQ